MKVKVFGVITTIQTLPSTKIKRCTAVLHLFSAVNILSMVSATFV